MLHAPYLMDDMRRAVEDGYFWERFVRIERWQSLLTEIGDDAQASSAQQFGESFLKLRPHAILEEDEWDMFMDKLNPDWTPDDIERMVAASFEAPPAEPLTAEEHRDLVVEALQKIRSEAGRSPEILIDALRAAPPKEWHGRLAAGMIALESVLGAGEKENPGSEGETKVREAPSAIDLASAAVLDQLRPAMIDQLEMRRQTRPEDFENILKQLDADYLLRSLSKATRKRLEKDAAAWARQCEEVVAAEYWPGNNLSLARVSFMVTSKLEPLINQHSEDVISICTDLRRRFCDDRRFVIRMLVETMQRRDNWSAALAEFPAPKGVYKAIKLCRASANSQIGAMPSGDLLEKLRRLCSEG